LMLKSFPVLLLVVFLTVPVVVALPPGNTVSVPLVADYRTERGEEGVLLNATVVVTNGSGHVFVDTRPYAEVDLQGSARLAAMVASDVLGVDQRNYDFYYIIDVPSPIVGGPSAGGALTVATIAALKNWSLRRGVVMTGMINPDESIGPVGGIPYKLEAAARGNATIFLVPEGQSKVMISEKVSQQQWPFVIVKEKTVKVDVAEKARKLGVELVEVGTIQKAVEIFTGHRLERPRFQGKILTPRYQQTLKPLAETLSHESKKMRDQIKSEYPQNPDWPDADQVMERADQMYQQEKYYAATSLYFNEMILLRNIKWSEEYKLSPRPEEYLQGLAAEVEAQINASARDIETYKKHGIVDVESVGAAESRVSTSRSQLEDALKMQDVDDYISTLAFAYERARTAQWWLTLADPNSKTVPEDVIRDRAAWYLSQARSIQAYTTTLLAESSGHPPSTLLSQAEEDLDNAQQELNRGYYSGALVDSLRAMVRASTIIGLMGITDGDKKVESIREDAEIAIADARTAGIEPTLAVSAYEFADTLESVPGKIFQYSYAKMIARTALALEKHATKTTIPPQKPRIQTTTRTPLPTAEPPQEKETPTTPATPAALTALAILLAYLLRQKT